MSVFAMVSAMAGFVKVRYLMDKAIIDNLVFRCHYRITSAMLFVSCVLVTANNLIGKFSSLKIYFRRESVSLIIKMGMGCPGWIQNEETPWCHNVNDRVLTYFEIRRFKYSVYLIGKLTL